MAYTAQGRLIMFFSIPFLAFIITLLIVPVVIGLARKFDYVAKPSKNRWHTRTTALLGGIAIFSGFIITVCIINDNWDLTTFLVLLSAFLMFVIGFRDDIKPLTPKIKLGSQLLVAVITISTGFHFSTGLGIFIDVMVSGIWIIGVINAVNLIDNMDGLSSGIAFIASTFIAILGVISNHSFLSITALSISGACLGFLVFNFKPAKIFMGDCGSLFLGYMLAILTVMLQGALGLDSTILGSFFIAVFILAVPLFDTFLVMVERKRHGRSIVQGGKDHTSHRLVYLLGSERKSVMILYGLGLLFGGLGLIGHYNSISVQYAVVIIGLFLALLLAYVLIRFVPIYEATTVQSNNIAKSEVAATKFAHGKKK